jgi:hypothetical protein
LRQNLWPPFLFTIFAGHLHFDKKNWKKEFLFLMLPSSSRAGRPNPEIYLLLDHFIQSEVGLSKFFRFRQRAGEGLPDFPWYMIPKPGKTYQMNTNVPNGHKIS